MIYKQVNYYELLGERVAINSFAAMVRSVARKLYELDSSVIEKMARDREVFPSWVNPAFSYDANDLLSATKFIEEGDIFIATGFSAYDCISFIRALLMKYDLDISEDFIYSAKT